LWLVALGVFAGVALYAFGYLTPAEPAPPATWRPGHRWYHDVREAD